MGMGGIGRYPLGTLRCDNRLAQELMDAGVAVRNPSLGLRTLHLQQSTERAYTQAETIPGRFAFIPLSL